MHQFRRRPHARRSFAVVAVTSALALVALLLPGSPAWALASGSGWSASWSYYAGNAFQYRATLPGVRLTGYATDTYGSRTTLGTIEDTADDNRCARVLLYAAGVGYIADRTTCGNGTSLTYSTGSFSDSLLVIVYRTYTNGAADRSHHTIIPASTGDAELRTVNTGASWSYYTSTDFQYTVTRPGVRIYGYGSHSGSQRTSLNSVEKTVGTAGCATGRVTAAAGTPISGATCGASGSYATFSSWAFTGWLNPEGCYQPTGGTRRCVVLNVPEPY